jgi:hypothetical protein
MPTAEIGARKGMLVDVSQLPPSYNVSVTDKRGLGEFGRNIMIEGGPVKVIDVPAEPATQPSKSQNVRVIGL